METVAIRPGQLFIWHGPALFIVNAAGEVGQDDPMAGFYFRETRFLSGLELRLDGQPPWPCAAGQTAPNELLLGLIHPETGDAAVPRRSVDLLLRYRLRFHLLSAELTLTNRTRKPLRTAVVWNTRADFADLLEAHEGRRQFRAPVAIARTATRRPAFRFRYRHRELPFETRLEVVGGSGWRIARGALRSRLRLDPGVPVRLELRVSARDVEPQPDEEGIRDRERLMEHWKRRRFGLSAPGTPAALGILRQAVEDLGSLALLEGEPDEWLTPAAGMPLYPALFGRDALTTTWQSSCIDGGAQLESALRRLGRLQATRSDPAHDAAPGRLVHSLRRGPLARLGKNPYGRYYGDQASPFLFIIALAQLYAWAGGTRRLERHWDRAQRILDWAREAGDRDGDGYIEYLTLAKGAPRHQGWKDSDEAIVYEDGRPVPAPIASCEVQGYWYAAQQLFAVLCAVRGRGAEARAYWTSAAELRDRFNRDWWMPVERYIGLALDPDKRLVRTITSNPGHCLAAGIISAEHLPPLVGRMFLSDLWSGWGIRTLSSAHPCYHPISYHLGSIWTVENATIAYGLRRFGFDARALELSTAVFDLAGLYAHRRAPECVGGYPRSEWPHPGAYPRANPLQAWNQSAPLLLLQAMLALQPVAPLDLLVIDPLLPPWLPELELRGLRVGGATADLRFWRDRDGRSHGEIVRKRGTLHLVRQQPPESLSASVRDRMSAFVDGVMHH